MIVLNILLASEKPSESKELSRIISGKLDGQMPGIEIHVDVVSTLREVRERAHASNAIMLHLNLEDACPDEVIAAIPELPQPVMVLTTDTDAAMHAKCKTAGATVITGETSPSDICSSILHCLGRSMLNAMKTLPAT